MTDFKMHTADTAPSEARPLLEASQQAFGFVPGLHAIMAESPQTLEAYQRLHELFQKTSFSAVERNVVWMAINVEHACHYCVPAHTGIAKMQGVDDETVEALREARPLSDDKLEALRQFTLAVLRKRGNVAKEDLDAFHAAGYEPRHVLEVILCLSQKVMSNYINHIADTPVDKVFEKFGWTPPARAAAE